MDKGLVDQIIAFRDARNWQQFHNPKDLAISLSLEAGELLECFQWTSSEEALATRRGRIAEELADVMIYAVLMAEATGLDLQAITEAKLAQNALNYPVDRAYGRKDKYDRL